MTTPSEDRQDSSPPGLQREARHKREALWEGASVSSLGIEMALAILIGVLVGQWLDGRFDTEPTFTIAFLFVGIAAAFKGLFRVARQHREKLARDRETERGASETRDAPLRPE